MIPPPNVTGVLHMGHALNGTRAGHRRPPPAHAGLRRRCGCRAPTTPASRRRPWSRRSSSRSRRRRARSSAARPSWPRSGSGRRSTATRSSSSSGAWAARCDWSRTRFTMEPATVARGARGLRAPVGEGAHLPRRAPRELGLRARRRPSPTTRSSTSTRKDKLYYIRYPVKGGAGRARHRRDDAARDDARRHGRRRAPGRRALHARSIGATLRAAARRPRDPDRRRRDASSATSAPARSRSRPATTRPTTSAARATSCRSSTSSRRTARSTRTPARSRASRARRRAKRVVEELDELGPAREGRGLRAQRRRSPTAARASIEPLVSEQWFVKMQPLAEPAIAAVEDGRAALPARALDQGLPRLARERARLVHHPPALVGAPHPGLVRRGRRAASRRATDLAIGSPHPKTGKPIVRQDEDVLDTWASLVAVAVRDARLAGRRPTTSRASTRRSSSRRRARSSTCGSRAWSWPATSSSTTCPRTSAVPFDGLLRQRDRARRARAGACRSRSATASIRST